MSYHEVVPGGPEAGKQKQHKVKILVEKIGSAMKVTIPGNLLTGESSIKIQWIDHR